MSNVIHEINETSRKTTNNCDSKNPVFTDQSSLESLPGPKELSICLKVVLVKTVEEYEEFSNYVCQLCELFVGKDLHVA